MAAPQIADALRLDAHVVGPGHAPVDFTSEESRLVIPGRRASVPLTAHIEEAGVPGAGKSSCLRSGLSPSRSNSASSRSDIRIAGRQQLVAVEDRIGPAEAQRLHLVAHRLAGRRQAQFQEVGIVMRLAAMVRTNSEVVDAP